MEKTSLSSKDEVTTLTARRHEARLNARLEPLRAALAQHAIYDRVVDIPSLRVFMTSHAFAVWDFMSLVKTLQRALTCVETPWLPARDTHAARLINAIVLAEETDEVAPGEYTSHFDLYLTAMDELRADRDPIDNMIRAVRRGQTVSDALLAVEIPESTRGFVRTTMRSAGGAVHEVAAAFLHGREDLVPMMFRRILGSLATDPTLTAVSFRRYLERHVDMDENDHSPMARQLLRSLCADDEAKWEQAAEAAAVSLTSRLELWDGVLEQIQKPVRRADTLAPPRSGTRRTVWAPAGVDDVLLPRKHARRA
jgi:Protein of unknown function (DUF3050)